MAAVVEKKRGRGPSRAARGQMTFAEAAKRVGMSYDTVARYAREGLFDMPPAMGPRSKTLYLEDVKFWQRYGYAGLKRRAMGLPVG